MERIEHFRPYEGEAPFLFISYAHADAPAVMEIVADLHRRGFRIWYDEGIELGSEWTESVGAHLAAASLMLGFISDAYMASDNCRREMNYAVQKKKKIVNIFLSPTTLTPGMELQIGGIWALMKYGFDSDAAFFQKLYAAPLLRSEDFGAPPEALALPGQEAPAPAPAPAAPAAPPPGRKKGRAARPAGPLPDPSGARERRRRRRRRALFGLLALLVFAAAALWGVGRYTGLIDRLYNRYLGGEAVVETLPGDTVAAFRSPALEAAARDYAGKPEGDLTVAELAGLTALYLCGDRYSFTGPYTLGEAGGMEAEARTAEGEGFTAARGALFELSDLQYFTGLRRVQLAFQSLSSLESLPGLALESLDVTGNRIASLQGVGSLPRLTELLADGNPVADVGDLADCTALTTLYMNGADPAGLSALKRLPELSRVRLSGLSYRELRPVLINSRLTEVELYGCDLRGDVFDMLDGARLGLVKLVSCELGDLGDADKLTAATLWLIDCSGVSDWSPLAANAHLRTLYADADTAAAFAGGEWPFEVVVAG